MFNLRKEIKKALAPKVNVMEVVANIHNEFDTATDRLLSEAKQIVGNTDKFSIDKAERLKKLGFSNSNPVTSTQKQLEAAKENEKLAETIMYFQIHYPNNKFITEKEVKRICQKYGLVFGDVVYYKGDVPEKNVTEMENFKLREEDMEKQFRYVSLNDVVDDYMGGLASQQMSYDRQMMMAMNNFPSRRRVRSEETGEKIKPQFKICAPKDDFDTTRMMVSDNYILQHIPDPIVLQPVKDGYLLVSKWGLEGQDESLVNETMN